jgi:hypothetical protein
MCRLYIDGVPDEYFQTPERQNKLKNVLITWCTHNAPYYRQGININDFNIYGVYICGAFAGMHEVCALILLALDMEAEALAKSSIPDTDSYERGRSSSVASGECDMMAALWRETLLDSVVPATVTYQEFEADCQAGEESPTDASCERPGPASESIQEKDTSSGNSVNIVAPGMETVTSRHAETSEGGKGRDVNVESPMSNCDMDCSSSGGGNEGDLYWIFDKIMARGLREIYRPDPATEREQHDIATAAAAAGAGGVGGGSAGVRVVKSDNNGDRARANSGYSRSTYASWEYMTHIQGKSVVDAS